MSPTEPDSLAAPPLPIGKTRKTADNDRDFAPRSLCIPMRLRVPVVAPTLPVSITSIGNRPTDRGEVLRA